MNSRRSSPHSQDPSHTRTPTQHKTSEREESGNSGDAQKLYGVMPIIEAIRAGRRQIGEIEIVEGARDHRLSALTDLAREHNIPIRRIPRSRMALGESGKTYQGVIATVAAARYSDPALLLEQIGTSRTEGPAPLIVVLDGVEDPRNLGAILRTVECAGANAVFLPERRAAGLTDVVAKSSAGALEYVPVARVVNIPRLIDELKAMNVWTVGTSGEAEMDYTEWDWTVPCALVLGNEGAGMHRLVKERCDAVVKIPVMGQIDSLNVSVAAGVILYEALRQRRESRPRNGV
jgi:23S rRNA (guanosine2251-2'-O)-methyltransferase